MSDALMIDELTRERAAHRQTVEALEAERARYDAAYAAVVAAMQAFGEHANQLRAAIEACHAHMLQAREDGKA